MIAVLPGLPDGMHIQQINLNLTNVFVVFGMGGELFEKFRNAEMLQRRPGIKDIGMVANLICDAVLGQAVNEIDAEAMSSHLSSVAETMVKEYNDLLGANRILDTIGSSTKVLATVAGGADGGNDLRLRRAHPVRGSVSGHSDTFTRGR